MPPINLVLADFDFEYVNHLAQWFIENKPHQFKLSVFTSKESFEKFFESKNNVDIILASEDFLIENIQQNAICIVLGQAVKMSGIACIEKYQPAPAICSDILSVISNSQHKAKNWYSSGKSDLVVCFSPNTYIRSTFALLLSALSKDYVYINLESFPLYMVENIQTYNRNLSDILYHIKSQKSNTVMALESAVITNRNHINFIPPLDNPRDLWELSETEFDVFIEALMCWGHFSKVIIDSECNTSPSTIKLFDAASFIVVPFEKTQINQIPRLKNMLNNIPGLDSEKVRWVLCGSSEELFSSEEMSNLYEFPWVRAYASDVNGFSLDPCEKNQLESLFK